MTQVFYAKGNLWHKTVLRRFINRHFGNYIWKLWAKYTMAAGLWWDEEHRKAIERNLALMK